MTSPAPNLVCGCRKGPKHVIAGADRQRIRGLLDDAHKLGRLDLASYYQARLDQCPKPREVRP